MMLFLLKSSCYKEELNTLSSRRTRVLVPEAANKTRQVMRFWFSEVFPFGVGVRPVVTASLKEFILLSGPTQGEGLALLRPGGMTSLRGDADPLAVYEGRTLSSLRRVRRLCLRGVSRSRR